MILFSFNPSWSEDPHVHPLLQLDCGDRKSPQCIHRAIHVPVRLRHRAHSYTLRPSHFSWLVKHIPPSQIFVPHGGGNHHPNIVRLVNPLPLPRRFGFLLSTLVTTLVSSLKDAMSEI